MGAEVAIKQYDEERVITPAEVRKFIAPTATDKELYMFLNICRAYGLNPFKREIHFIKYSKNEQASIVVGYEVYIKRAERSGKLDGWEVEVAPDASEATVTIYRKDWTHPFKWTVYREEVDRSVPGKKTPWSTSPKFMMAKTAIGQGFRLCLTEELGGMPYLPEEMQETAGYDMQATEVVEMDAEESAVVQPGADSDNSKRIQSKAEIKSWAILNELGIDQAAWKQDMYEKYSISSMAELEPKTWSKITSALEKYQECILLICGHWQCVSKELREFLVYKFGHRIGESFDTLHEALNSENGKMAELYEEFKVWKESPEEESEDESGELPAQETSEPSEISEQDKLLAQIREVLEAAGHDSTYIENRLQGLAHQKAGALKEALATAKKQAENANGNQGE